MKNLRVANRYAKAFLGLAAENDFSERAFQDMKLVYEAFMQSKDLKTVLKSPIVRISRKLNIITAIFEQKLHPVSMHYLTIITRKKRAALIEGIAYEYLKIHRESLDIEKVTLVAAGPVEEAIYQQAHAIALKLTPKKNIEFHVIEDPRIIGGFVLRVGDLQYDASIKTKLAKIKKHLMES
ncbi:MAG: ATP synthase F1 subunit delta [Bacteroidales bacterium]